MASLAFRSILRNSPQILRSNCHYLPVRIPAAIHIARMSNISTLDVSLIIPIKSLITYGCSDLPRSPPSRSLFDALRGQGSQEAYFRTNCQRARTRRSSRCSHLLWPSTGQCSGHREALVNTGCREEQARSSNGWIPIPRSHYGYAAKGAIDLQTL